MIETSVPSSSHPFELPTPKEGFSQSFLQAMKGPAEAILGLEKLGFIWKNLDSNLSPSEFLEQCLASLGQTWVAEGLGKAHFPLTGPTVVVANHPYGGIEGMILTRILLGIREDVRVLGNPLLCRIPQLAPVIIPTDPFEHADGRNLLAIRRAGEHLARGGCLLFFPSGTVSHFQPNLGGVVDPPWKKAAALLALKHRAAVVPVHVSGSNGPLFQAAGMVHPLLRTALIPREILAKRKPIRLRIGTAIGPDRLQAVGDAATLTHYLRHRVYLMGGKTHRAGKRAAPLFLKPVAPAEPLEVLRRELKLLNPSFRLLAQGEFEVWCVPGSRMPHILKEIGRLREETFRAAGEGTGKALDLDRFDRWYEHLFIWHPGKGEVVGAYRIGVVDEILPRLGKWGLYTHTCFHFHRRFFESLPLALELGRSFVRLSWQKEYAPLLLLWKGIAARVVRDPRHRVLFGAVSMDNTYTPRSRELVVAYLKQHQLHPLLAKWVKPRIPVSIRKGGSVDLEKAVTYMKGVEDLGEAVANREADGRGIPVLFRQYLKLGGRMAAFHRDPKFGNVMDALVVVDLDQTPHKALEKYLGRDGMEVFTRFRPDLLKLTES